MRTIGAADGVIMPTIMTVHMTNVNANSVAAHGPRSGPAALMPGISAIAGILGIAGMEAIDPCDAMSSFASQRTYAHASAVVKTSAPATIQRSRRRTDSMIGRFMINE